jgi:hypothetical protein
MADDGNTTSPELLREVHPRDLEHLILEGDVSLVFEEAPAASSSSTSCHIADFGSLDFLNADLSLNDLSDSAAEVLTSSSGLGQIVADVNPSVGLCRSSSDDISGDGILGFSSPYEASSASASTSTAAPTAVPFNSPNDSQLEEILKAEAKKQESQIRERLGDASLLELFKTPVRPSADVPRPRKRLRESPGEASSSEHFVMEELELMKKEDRFTVFNPGDSTFVKV